VAGQCRLLPKLLSKPSSIIVGAFAAEPRRTRPGKSGSARRRVERAASSNWAIPEIVMTLDVHGQERLGQV
jgi:hypothetical protein